MNRLILPAILAVCFLLILPLAAAPISISSMSPANGATGVCVDTPLQITFSGPPQSAAAGTIRVFQADGTLFDSITVGAPSQKAIGGFTERTVITTTTRKAIWTLLPSASGTDPLLPPISGGWQAGSETGGF